MKRFIYLLILCCYTLWGQAAIPTEVDSLQRQLQTLPHDSTRLKLIQKALRADQASPKCIELSNLLLSEANKQNELSYAGTAIYFQIIYYYNQNKIDSVNKRLVELEPYARKANLWDFYFDGMRCAIDLLSYREEFEQAINQSVKMNEKAKARNNVRGQIGSYQCLSNAYLGTGRMKEAEEALKKAHKLLPHLKNIVVKNSVLTQLIALSHEVKDYADQMKYLKEQEQLLNNFIATNADMKEAFADPFLFNKIYQTYYYNDTKQPEVALSHLLEARKYLTSNSYFMYRVLYHDAYTDYYRLRKDYGKALVCVDSTIAKLESPISSDHIHQLKKKADILIEAGRKQEALPIYQKVLHIKDSLDKSLSDKQMQLIQEDYHVDKLRLEKELLRNKIQLTALIVVLLAIITLSFFTVRMYHLGKALKLSEQQTREATQTAEKANETKNRFLSNMSYNIRIPLNGVVGFSQLIAMDPDMEEETRKEYSVIIQKNTEELMRLVNDVLDLSRLEADMMKFQVQEYDILSLCQDVFYTTNEKNKEQIDIQFQPHIESVQNITVDVNRLAQLLISALTYPQPREEEKRIIRFTLESDAENKLILGCISNCPLADPTFLSQEVSIRHDINRLLLEHFGGTYTVMPDAPEGPTVVFTYPFSVSE